MYAIKAKNVCGSSGGYVERRGGSSYELKGTEPDVSEGYVGSVDGEGPVDCGERWGAWSLCGLADAFRFETREDAERFEAINCDGASEDGEYVTERSDEYGDAYETVYENHYDLWEFEVVEVQG